MQTGDTAATKSDLKDLGGLLVTHVTSLENRLVAHMTGVETRLVTHTTGVETRLVTLVADVETRLVTLVADVETRLKKELVDRDANLRKEMADLETRLITHMADQETRLTERTQEFVRDAQTEVLRGFQTYVAGRDVQFRKLKADFSNLDAATELRIELVEKRLLEIEKRLMIGGDIPPKQ